MEPATIMVLIRALLMSTSLQATLQVLHQMAAGQQRRGRLAMSVLVCEAATTVQYSGKSEMSRDDQKT